MHDQIQSDSVVLRLATDADRERIYRHRHEVYACELRQYAERSDCTIKDSLDDHNEYIIAEVNDVILGFVSVTPPGPFGFSVDKYLRREEFSELNEEGTFEVRLLTVLNPYRGRELALLLMYAVFRWVESHGGKRLMAIGRREVLSLYLRVGLTSLGFRIRSGAVTYELLTATTERVREALGKYTAILNRMERGINWKLDCPFHRPARCFHGGTFFEAIGTGFGSLERRDQVINADVLDAWFPPSPKVIAALQTDLPWLLRTSPPTGCEGMIAAISRARKIPSESIVPGAGSSALIFLALQHWLNADSRVLILDPTYGEYAHVLEQVIRCRVDRFRLYREKNYHPQMDRLQALARRNYDLIVLVNPNSPTGRHMPTAALKELLRSVPASTRVWIDETYVDYVGRKESLETFAVASENVVVCKSMSKVYALSGARAAYLCGPRKMMEELRAITPPWAVSLIAQVSVVAALDDPEYYAKQFAETHRLREAFAKEIVSVSGWKVVPGVANFLLCHLPETGPNAHEIVERCKTHGLFLRDAGAMGQRLGSHAVRIAIKDESTNRRMLSIIARVNADVRSKAAISRPLFAPPIAADAMV